MRNVLSSFALFLGVAALLYIGFNVSVYFWEPKQGGVILHECAEEEKNASGRCEFKGIISQEPWTGKYIVESGSEKITFERDKVASVWMIDSETTPES